MTSVEQQAAEVLTNYVHHMLSGAAVARALAEHEPPLLMPDPTPQTPYYVEHIHVATSIVSNGVTISIDGDAAWVPQDDLVSVARALLAAAAHAEKENES